MSIEVNALSKAFGDKSLFAGLSFRCDGGLVLRAPSGWGKTTLLRILMGLETADGGCVRGVGRVAAVFQEDRLIPHLTGEENIALVCGSSLSAQEIRAELLALGLLPEALALPAARLSGGQKRRVVLARALLAPADTLILDEPFTGLDGEAAQKAIERIKLRRGERPVLVATHDPAAITLLGWPVLELNAAL